MAVDREALRKIVAGDPNAKIAVRRQWLAEVMKKLDDLDALRKKGSYADRIEKVVETLTGKRAA
jgi:hypothetical protein